MEILKGNIHEIINGDDNIAIRCKNVTELNMLRMVMREHGETWCNGNEYKPEVQRNNTAYDIFSVGYYHFPKTGMYSISVKPNEKFIKFSSLDYGNV